MVVIRLAKIGLRIDQTTEAKTNEVANQAMAWSLPPGRLVRSLLCFEVLIFPSEKEISIMLPIESHRHLSRGTS